MKKYRNTELSFEARAADLVSHMKLKEKQLQMISGSPGIKRLGIKPHHWWNECLHGVARAGIATVFPQAIALAATFDPELMFEISNIISDEARAKHHEAQRKKNYSRYAGLTFWSPNINIFRDPRWGRGQETYGEDPYLTAQLGISFVKGLQGNDPKYLKVVATPKHYVVHSGPEAERHRFNAIASKKDLYETYLFAFKECIEKADAYSIMGAYNRTNGESCCASKTLLQEILRDQFQFKGFVVSDCGGIKDIHAHHKITSSPAESAALAVKMGCDLNCGGIYRFLKKAVKKKLITEKKIDVSLNRLMLARMKLGMFDPPEMVPYAKIPITINDCPKHREVALNAAERSIVLLKNQDNILPLQPNNQKIAILGPNANDEIVLLGNYHGIPSKSVTPLEGFRAQWDSAHLIYSKGTNILTSDEELLKHAINAAQSSELIVLCVGLSQKIEGEENETKGVADREKLGLPENQMQLFKKIKELNKPIIIVLLNGSPILLDWAYNDPAVNAILEAWYPGEEGGTAIANIVSGKVSPSGRLPFTIPIKMDDLPSFRDYSMKGRTYRYIESEPLFPFGYGLSYAKFEYKNLKLDKNTVKIGDDINVSVDITNTSGMEADEVVQLYLKDKEASVEVPHHSLQGVKRVHLSPNQTQTVKFLLSARQMAIINTEGKAILEPGEFEIFIGGQQPDKKSKELTQNSVLSIIFNLNGDITEIKY